MYYNLYCLVSDSCANSSCRLHQFRIKRVLSCIGAVRAERDTRRASAPQFSTIYVKISLQTRAQWYHFHSCFERLSTSCFHSRSHTHTLVSNPNLNLKLLSPGAWKNITSWDAKGLLSFDFPYHWHLHLYLLASDLLNTSTVNRYVPDPSTTISISGLSHHNRAAP